VAQEEREDWQDRLEILRSLNWSHWIAILVVTPLATVFGMTFLLYLTSLLWHYPFRDLYDRYDPFVVALNVLVLVMAETAVLAWAFRASKYRYAPEDGSLLMWLMPSKWRERARSCQCFDGLHWTFLLVVIPVSAVVGITVHICATSIVEGDPLHTVIERQDLGEHPIFLLFLIILEMALFAGPFRKLSFPAKTASAFLGTAFATALFTFLSPYPLSPPGLHGALGAFAFLYVANDWQQRRLIRAARAAEPGNDHNGGTYRFLLGFRPRFMAGIAFCCVSLAMLPISAINIQGKDDDNVLSGSFHFICRLMRIDIQESHAIVLFLAGCVYALLAFRILTNEPEPERRLDVLERIAALAGLGVVLKIMVLSGFAGVI